MKLKRFQIPAPKPADVDVPLAAVEAELKRLALQQAYEHQPEPMETEFADLAIHPTGHLATDADYPDFHPGGGA